MQILDTGSEPHFTDKCLFNQHPTMVIGIYNKLLIIIHARIELIISSLKRNQLYASIELNCTCLHNSLAHLSRRLIGELIVYQWSGVGRPSVVRRPSSTMLKDLLLRNRWANQSQILCGASLGRGNDILFAASGSHDQDGRHAHIW